MQKSAASVPASETICVSSLNALAYCKRLFYLQEVEGLREANADIYEGLRLHAKLEKESTDEWHNFILENTELGLRGKVDALKTRAGQIIPYEHKKGRSYRDSQNQPQAWKAIASKSSPMPAC
ncbi:CRISPR-associated protein Cas4 [Sphaerothrix gracilis]|uniref:CRISPR-associated protein Cas4 n=1 Tax=Sphaerothrix gracilis TaxID=3151835 RepID=UPI0031FC43D0